MGYLNHYKCVKCNRTFSLMENVLVCGDCGHLLLVEYDLYRARQEMYQKKWPNDRSMWRFVDLLPNIAPEKRISLNEGATPIQLLRKMSMEQAGRLFMLDEGANPTGNLADREMSLFFSALQSRLKKGVLLTGSPNSCISAAAYAERAGIPAAMVIWPSLPNQFLGELTSYGVETITARQKGAQLKAIQKQVVEKQGLIAVTPFSSPFRVEGAKTLFLDVWQRFNSRLPDYIFLPLGEGVSLIGFWKALNELRQLGELNGKMPTVVVVESAHNAVLMPKLNPYFVDSGHSESVAQDFNAEENSELDLLLEILRQEKWPVAAVDDEQILKVRKQIARTEGILLSPEGCAAIAAYQNLKSELIKEGETHSVLFINPVNGSKYVQSIGFLGN